MKFDLLNIIAYHLVAGAIILSAGAACGGAMAANRDSRAPVDDAFNLPKREHPYLILDSADFQEIFARGNSPEFPRAQSQFRQLLRTADAAVSVPLSIPEIPGEWWHHYVCTDCGVRLDEQGSRHICPRCGKEFTGWPYDGVVAARKHGVNVDNAQLLGVAYQLTKKVQYAERARKILISYADRYTSFPIHDFEGSQSVKGARLTAQTLNEAIAMISLAWAYDLVYNAPGTTEQHRRHIEQNLLRPAALIIRRNDMGTSNWQTWHNASIACIGYVLNDPEMVNHAINGKSGIWFQLESSVLPDGFWHEGAASYHFYALAAMQTQALAMQAAGNDFYKDAKFESMYATPLDYMFPDGSFPAVNDSDTRYGELATYYEVANMWFDDNKYAAALHNPEKSNLNSLLFGAKELEPVEPAALQSRVFSGLGAAMLRNGTGTAGRELVAHLDFGPHGGAHGHPDKLGLIFFANGSDIVPDPGRLAYGAPLHNLWYKTTVAHNTVAVDGRNQQAAEGKLVSSDFSGDVKMVTVACDTAYHDVALSRSVALAPGYLLDVFTGASVTSQTWDLAYHIKGTPVTDLSFRPRKLAEKKHGYQILANVRSTVVTDPYSIRFRSDDRIGGLDFTQLGIAPQEIILADGVTGSAVTTCPVVLSRQHGSTAQWITLAAPGNPRQFQMECEANDGGWIIRVKSADDVDLYHVRAGEIKKAGG